MQCALDAAVADVHATRRFLVSTASGKGTSAIEVCFSYFFKPPRLR